MSRNTEMLTNISDGFPRVSGDEPSFPVPVVPVLQFSPRERG